LELNRLDQLAFCPYHQVDAKATEEFYTKLLNSLARTSALKELSIGPFSLSKQHIALIPFLLNTKLEHLHLDIIEANRFSWEELCRVLEKHPMLQTLNLGNSALDGSAYKALTDLLDKNYKIEITLPEPTNAKLLPTYQPLKQRLAKPGIERFKEKYLSQDNLFQIAIDSLESLKKFKLIRYQNLQQAQLEKQFDFLLRSQASQAILDGNYADVLHPIYQNHRYMINEASPALVQLSIDTLAKNSTQSRGYILLKKL